MKKFNEAGLGQGLWAVSGRTRDSANRQHGIRLKLSYGVLYDARKSPHRPSRAVGVDATKASGDWHLKKRKSEIIGSDLSDRHLKATEMGKFCHQPL